MAVEIPVVIDIDKAFEDAAKRVDSAIKPLKSKMDKATADLTFKVGVVVDDEGESHDVVKSIEQLIGKIKDKSKYVATPIQELTEALSSAKEKYSELEAKAARYGKLSKEDNNKLGSYQRAIVLLTQEIEMRQHGVNLIEQETQAAINAVRQEEQRLAIIQRSATTMSQQQAKLGALQGQLQNTEIGSTKWIDLLTDIKSVEAEIERVAKDIRDLGMETGSLNSLNAQMQDLQKMFSSMGSKKLFNADGSPSAELQKMQQQYANLRTEADKVSKALSAEYDAQKKAAQEAEAIAEAKRRQTEAEKEHQRVLSSSASTLDQYNAKLSAWRKELNSADVSSPQFSKAAQEVQKLTDNIERLAYQIRVISTEAGSINQLNVQLQEVNRQYNALSVAERQGTKGQKLLQQYRDISAELEKQGKSLQQIVQEEQRLASLKEKNLGRQKYENAILNTKVKTMRILQEQERILSDRLSRTEIGTAKYEQLEDQIRRVRYEMQQATGASTNLNKSLSAQTGIFSSLKGQITAYASVLGVFRFAKQIRDVTAELEFQRIALSRLIQDEEYGAILFDRIKNDAVESPFRITDLVTYTKQLAAYRVEQENLFSTTKMLADVSAGLGVDMNRLILAYGQVRAASVLRGQELRQFTEAGIPLVELLAEKFSDLRGEMVTTADVFKLISDRAVPFSMISDIFVDMTEKGGMFYEMQKKQSETLKGRWEKLKDTFDIALQSIGDTGYFRFWNKVLIDSLTFLANHLILVPKLLSAVTYGWIAWNAAILLSTKRTIAKINADKMLMAEMTAQNAKVGKLTISILGEAKARGLLKNAIYKQSVANNILTRTFWKLWAAMLSNPITAIIAGISALTAAFLTFRKKTDATVESVKNFEDSISEMSEANKKFKRMEGAIKVYEKLASKTERTSDENIRLAKTMDKLKETFPELTSLINQDNIALDEKVKKLKEVNAEQLKAVRDSKESELESAKVFIEKLTGDKLKKQDIVDRIGESLKVYRAAEKEGLKVFEEEDLMGRKRFFKRYDLPTDEIITSEENIRKKIKEVNAEYNKQKSELEGIISELRTWETRAERLNKQLHPEEAIKDWTEWQKLIKSTQEGIISEGQAPLFTDDDISGLESVYELFNKLKKAEKEHTENLNGMNAALSKMTEGEAKQNLQKDIESEKRLLQTIKALKDVFGFDFSQIVKKSDKTALSFLKEELKNVQEIYKRYKELIKYMDEQSATEKIKEIYGDVTAIDFLSPEKYKKRLSEILSDIRNMQGTVKKYNSSLSNEMFQDIKDAIKKNEGLRLDAYKLAGEKGYTIGYGFYDKLPNGKKITEGMRITEEDAEKYLEMYIRSFSDTTARLLSEYGQGLELTERQFNVLVDLAFQGPAALKKALKNAKGDISALAEELKHAATDLVAPQQKKAVKVRDMKRYAAFIASGLVGDNAEEIAQSIFDAELIVQNVDFDELKQYLEDNLKKLSAKIKRSETARNFYNEILGLTGDKDLATAMTVSIYTNTGDEFKERLQRELDGALSSLKSTKGFTVSEELKQAFLEMDFEKILKEKKLPENVEKVVREAYEKSQKYNADILKNFANLVNKYGDTQQKIATISAKAENDVAKVKEAIFNTFKEISRDDLGKYLDINIPLEESFNELDEKAQNAIKRAREIIKALYGQRDIDIFKQSDDYIKFFSEINVLTTEQAVVVREKLRDAYLKAFHDGAISADELKRNLRAIDEQFRKLNENSNAFTALLSGGFDGLNKKLMEYSDNITILASKLKKGIELDKGEQAYATKMLKFFGGGYADTKGINSYTKLIEKFGSNSEGLSKAGDALGAMGNGIGVAASNAVAVIAIIDAILKGIKAAVDGVNEMISLLNEVRSETNKIQNDGWDAFTEWYNYTFSGWEKVKSGDVVGSLFDVINSWVSVAKNVILGDIKKIDEQIQWQQKLIDGLEKSYENLEEAIQDSFGTEYVYNYNRMLENLASAAEAYRKQAELERSKGKAADENIAKEYEDKAEEAIKKTSELTKELREFFAGENLTSAAESFADAWLQAYQEFGDTTGAIEERMQEMIQNLVKKAALSGIAQSVLGNWYKSLSDVKEWNAKTVAEKWREAESLVTPMVEGMKIFTTELQSEGKSLRGTAGSFTGIARNIANASEESINGLAAGINTQNYYMQHIDQVVSAILLQLGGKSDVSYEVQQYNPYQQAVLGSLGKLTTIDENIAQILTTLKSVVSTGTSAPPNRVYIH